VSRIASKCVSVPLSAAPRGPLCCMWAARAAMLENRGCTSESLSWLLAKLAASVRSSTTSCCCCGQGGEWG
jgi:hypothetical protein